MGVDIGDGSLSPIVKLNFHGTNQSSQEEQKIESSNTTSVAMTPQQLHALIHGKSKYF